MHEKRPRRVDLDALTGLRGVIAFHIVVFHCFFYSELKVNLLGSTQLPLFFLISGFTLTIANGRTQYVIKNCCAKGSAEQEKLLVIVCQEPQMDVKPLMDWWHFMKKRIARILPMYWLAIAEALPIVFLGYAHIPPTDPVNVAVTALLSFGFLSTWGGYVLVINGPAWFVSPIWFFYLLFPTLLPRLQAYSSDKKRKWLIWHYWIQLGGGIALFFFFAEVLANPDLGANFATMWPISRLPLFLMGILAALLRYEDPNAFKPPTCVSQTWHQHVNFLAAALIITLVVWSIIENYIEKSFGILIGGNLWLQLIIPALHLPLIYSLTFDDARESLVSRALHSRLALELGRLSYAWYLVHEPMIYYLAFALNGPLTWPDDGDEAAAERFDANRRIPAWGIPVVIVTSFLVALVLNRLFEEPLGKLLRPRAPVPMDSVTVKTEVKSVSGTFVK